MAIIKNFGLAGVGNSVQFGKGGAKLVQAEGGFSAKTSDEANLVRFAIANAVSGDDAVTLSQLTAAVEAVAGDAEALQLELDATQTGAGLNSDGEYIAKTVGILAGAVSLADADDKLAAAIAAEIGDREAADLVLSDDIANVATDLVEVSNELSTTQTSIGLTPEGELSLAAGNYLGNATSLTDAVELLDAATKAAADDAAQALLSIDGTEEAIEALEGNVAAMQDSVGELEANAIAQQGQIDAVIAKNEQQDGRLLELEGNASALEGEIEALEDRALALEGNSVAQQGEIDALEDAVAALDAAAIKHDGSVAFTGNQSMGDHLLSNVATPVDDGDAANKLYVDSKVANLGNAFNYVTTISGGEDEASAFDLETLPEDGRDVGDYYKVISAGYIKLGTEVVYFNQNDGVVFNASEGFDKIDNTDATSAGVAGQIEVSGSTDTGYIIGIDASYTAARQLEVSNEANARAQEDVALGLRIDGVEADLAQELLDRANAVAVVDGRVTDLIEGEIADLEANAVAQQGEIAALEANAVAQQADILALQQAQEDDSRLLALEANAVTQQGEIDALEGRADVLEANAIAQQGEIEALAGRAGELEANAIAQQGEIAALEGRADVLEANAIAQQGEIEALAEAMENLSQDTIISTGEVYSVHAADDKIVMAQAEASTTIEMTLSDGEAILAAVDGEHANVDLRLMAQGDGSVVIGDEGVGVIQADDGYNMIVAGGEGADLQLIGQAVRIQDADQGDVAVFTGAGSAVLGIETGNTAVTFAATGVEANVDLVFDPKGAGRADFSGAQVVGVAAGTSADHAVNKGQMDAALASAEVGHVAAISAQVDATNGAVIIGNVNGVVTRIRVVILNAYNSGASIVVGNETVAADLVAASDIDEASAGIYVIDTAREYVDTDVIVTVAGASAGAAKVYVEYIKD